MTTMEEKAKEIDRAQMLLGLFVGTAPEGTTPRPLTADELQALRLVVAAAIVPREVWKTMVAAFEESRQLRDHLRDFIGVH